MLASLLFTGLVLAEPGATISYHKKVMIDPDYRPSRTADEIRTKLSRARRTAPAARRVVWSPADAAPLPAAYYADDGRTAATVASYATAPAAVRTVYAEPRVRWNVGLSYGGGYDGWGGLVGVSYGYPTSYGYAYPGYYSSCGSPFSWSVGLGYNTSWGYLGLGYSSGAYCGRNYGWGGSHCYSGRRRYR